MTSLEETPPMDAAAMKALQRRLKKNSYQRQKQATYRKMDKMEIAFQRERVVVLEEMLEQARAKRFGHSPRASDSTTSILSWQDIALAIQESEEMALEKNARLKRQVVRARNVMEELKTWVYTRIPTYPASSTWRNVGLTQNRETRQIGLDWITKHLFYNTDMTFQKYEFPAPNSSEVIDDYLYFYDGDGLVAVQRNQYIANAALEDFYSRITSDNFMGEVNLNKEEKPCNPEILHRVYDNRGVRTNFVSRVKVEPDRIAFVGQHINDDEVFPTQGLQRHRVIMCFYERVGPRHTKIRSLQLMSSLFDQTGNYISVDDEAKFWGFDLGDCPEYLKRDRFLQCTKAAIAKQIAKRQISLIKKSS